MYTMLAPQIPLRMMAQYEHVTFPEGGTLDERKTAVKVALKNCQITRDIGTNDMNYDSDLMDDIHKMRAAALSAIPLAESALRAGTLEDFNTLESEFRTLYVSLIGSVKSFLWDSTKAFRHKSLYELSEDLM